MLTRVRVLSPVIQSMIVEYLLTLAISLLAYVGLCMCVCRYRGHRSEVLSVDSFWQQW
jgi:hypothetical protein